MASSYIAGIRARIGNELLLLPAVAASILDVRGRLLLQQKARAESWSLPAGGIEPGESPAEAMLREAREETGWHVSIEHILGVFGGETYRHTYPNGDRVEYVVTLFRCRIIGGDGVPCDRDPLSLRYFDRAEMPALALPYPLDRLFSPS